MSLNVLPGGHRWQKHHPCCIDLGLIRSIHPLLLWPKPIMDRCSGVRRLFYSARIIVMLLITPPNIVCAPYVCTEYEKQASCRTFPASCHGPSSPCSIRSILRSLFQAALQQLVCPLRNRAPHAPLSTWPPWIDPDRPAGAFGRFGSTWEWGCPPAAPATEFTT